MIKSRCPKNNKYYQQKLAVWTPNFHAKFVGFFFLISGFLFMICGIFVYIVQRAIVDLYLDYTDCLDKTLQNQCSKFKPNRSKLHNCVCILNLDITYPITAPVFFYYELQNFFQNHRRFRSSKDDDQLKGLTKKKLSSDCEPIRFASLKKDLKYAPCGLFANSIFNGNEYFIWIKYDIRFVKDTFQISLDINNQSYIIPWSNKNISWKSDKYIVFGKPSNWDNTLKPPNWNMTALERNKDSYSEDEELIVWMKGGFFSTFKKLHRILITTSYPFKNGLPIGNYILVVDYAYPVKIFKGRKSIYISSTGILGGKNHFIYYFPLILAVTHLILGMTFLNIDYFTVHKYDFPNQTVEKKNNDLQTNKTITEVSEAGEHYQKEINNLV